VVITPLGTVIRGVVAGLAGVVAMDAVLYARYRREGGTDDPIKWNFGGPSRWDRVSAPGKLGKQLYEGFTQEPLPATRARLTNNLMHWSYGALWGGLYGLVGGSIGRRPLSAGPAFGAAVWGSSYVILPAAGLYKPIWEYDTETLLKDLGPHLVYGTAVDVVFRLLA